MNDKKAIAYLSEIVGVALKGDQIDKFDSSIKSSIENPDLLNLFSLIESCLFQPVKTTNTAHKIIDVQQNVEFPPLEPIISQITDIQKKVSEIARQSQPTAQSKPSSTNDFINNLSGSFNSVIEALCEREKLEQAVTESKKKYQIITENVSDVIWIMDIKTLKFNYISPSIFNLRGITAEEALNESLTESLLPDSAEKAKYRFELLYKKIKNKEFLPNLCDEYQQRCKNGQIIDVEISTSIIYDENGQPKEILGINRNITERKKAELALKDSEEKYRLITENTRDVIWKIDIKTLKYTYVSPSLVKLTGHKPEELLNVPFANTLTTDSIRKALRLLREMLNKPLNHELDYCERFQIISKEGVPVDIEASISFIYDENGMPIESLGVSRNISAQVKTEKALKESQAKLAKLIERQSIKNKQLVNQLQYIYNNANGEIAFFDIDGDKISFSSCNKMWAENIGYKPEELQNLNISELNDQSISNLYRRFILNAIVKGEPIQEYLNWNNRHLHIIVIPIKNEKNDIIKSCGSFVYDITDRIEAELKIQETEERFFAIFNNSKDAIILMNIATETIEVNEGFYQLVGSHNLTKENILNHYIPPKYHDSLIEHFIQLKDSKSTPTFESELIKEDGTLIPVEFSSSIITLNQTSMILCFVRDISIRKNMDKMLTQIGIQIENRERRKMAADLHDNVGPLLSSMNMYLSALSRKPDLTPYNETITDIQRILKETISSVREISNNLSPQVLQNYGLTAALELFFKTKLRIIDLNIENNLGSLRFEEIKEVMIYNIIKELFNNSIKHSNASLITLKIEQKNNSVFVGYSDNGIGFEFEEKMNSTTETLGLFSIINRVKNIDGTYKMLTSQGKGFSIGISFPVLILNDNGKN